MNSHGIKTYCSPYDLSFENRNDGLRAYRISDFSPSEATVTYSRVYNVKGGTGIVLMGNAGEYTIPVEITNTQWTNMLVGVVNATALETEDGSYTNFILGVTDGGAINWAKALQGTLGANKAYLQLPTESVNQMMAANQAQQIRWIFDDDSTTGIKEFTNERTVNSKSDYYTLDGRRIVGKPSMRGIYIVNGKKVYVK